MKRVFFAIAAIISFACTSSGDDRPIAFEKLPAAAQEFIKANFPGETPLLVTKDDDFLYPDYSVVFQGGTSLEFDSGGAFSKIESKTGAIPESFVPEPIRAYVNANFPGCTYREYSVGRRGRHEVELSNGMELKFDSRFVLVGIDD